MARKRKEKSEKSYEVEKILNKKVEEDDGEKVRWNLIKISIDDVNKQPSSLSFSYHILTSFSVIKVDFLHINWKI